MEVLSCLGISRSWQPAFVNGIFGPDIHLYYHCLLFTVLLCHHAMPCHLTPDNSQDGMNGWLIYRFPRVCLSPDCRGEHPPDGPESYDIQKVDKDVLYTTIAEILG